MRKTAFLFPGQGSQVIGMGRDFYEHFPPAREIFGRADEVLGFKISELCFNGPEEVLRLTRNTQPALLTVSTIAFSLLGQEPCLAAGHSLGEYSALVAAEALDFEDALLLVHKRGTYMQEAVPVGEGAMAAILGKSVEEVREGLDRVDRVHKGIVEIANWNSQEQIVISGRKEAVEEALKNIHPPRSVLLPVSAPFHCALMESAEKRLSEDLAKVRFRDPKFPIVTNVDAGMIRRTEEARDALRRQVSRPVRWYESMELMNREGVDLFVELGPGKVLTGLVKRIARGWERPVDVLNVEDLTSLEKAREVLSKAL